MLTFIIIYRYIDSIFFHILSYAIDILHNYSKLIL